MSSRDIPAALVTEYIAAAEGLHILYSNTATCRSKPGVISGSAMTWHCAATCSNPAHDEVKARHARAYHALRQAVMEAVD